MEFEPSEPGPRSLSVDLSERTLRLENVRDGVSFEVRPRRVTALFGSDDASSLLTVALGLVRPEQGRVTVDGVDLDDLDPSAWWSEVAWVPQRPALVAGSIAENIRMGWSATDAEVADAAR